jgi:hypothetical protein
MSSLLVDPNDSPVQRPYDKYWDAPMTRREAHTLFMKLASNDSELMGMADTAALLLNFILERKLNITDRKEIDDYVEVKKSQMAAQREQMKAAADNQADGVKDVVANG